jgi:hypothetical protein
MQESYKDKFLNLVSNPLVVGSSFSLYAIFVRFYVFPKYSFLLNPDFTLIQNFIEWFGVAYGLFIALVLVNVWSQYDTTEREFDREADAVYMLYEAVKQVKETRWTKTPKKDIIDRIKKYVSHVSDNYKKEHQNLKLREAGDQILEEIRECIGRLVHTTAREPITSALIQTFNETMDLRGDRISHSKQHIPEPVWGIALASSILWLIPFYGLDFKNDWVAIVLVGGVTAVVVAILVIIKDLDDPFEGTWKIDISEWELLGEKVELKRTVFFVYNLHSSRFAGLWAGIQSWVSKHPCALYRLMNQREQQVSFDDVAAQAYFRIAYKDDFERFYEKLDTLPAVVCKSNGKSKVIVEPAEINATGSLAELKLKIEDKLASLCF